MTSLVMDIKVISQSRIFPESRVDQSASGVHNVPLTITDATAAQFSPTAAMWMFDPATEIDSEAQTALSPDQMKLSFQKTLSAYTQWAGQLHLSPYKANGNHMQRLGRLSLSYGAASDPGVEFVSAHSPSNLSALVPSTKTRMTGLKWVDLTHLPSDELLPLVPLALHNMIDYAGLPGMMVQLTTLACGSCVLAIKMAHPLADAQALMCFMHDWAATNRAMLASTLLPSLSPIFDPSLVDQAATGDIDALEPDQSLVQKVRRLPLHRFD